MKLNREKVAAFVAGLLLAAAAADVVLTGESPGRDARVEVSLPTYSRELIPRRHRSFTADAADAGGAGRNPFSFSEGWQALEAARLPPPPVPPMERVAPTPGAGADSAQAGFLYLGAPPAEIPAEGGKP